MIKVYYHKNCFDGICSAWVAWRNFGESAEYIPINYGEDYTSLYQDCYENAIINDEIYFIDFSLSKELMDLIYNKAKKLVVLDHHKTAKENIGDRPEYAIFDMTESGASLAWNYFFGSELPKLVRYIKDRDLWLYKEPNSHEINAYIQSFEMTIENYANLYIELEDDINSCIKAGSSIERYKNTMVKSMCKNAVMKNIGDYIVPVVNASILFSEVGHELCQPNKHGISSSFAAYYFDRGDGKRQWGLRSIGDFDVSEVAKKYGGGGHKNAAGFITEISE